MNGGIRNVDQEDVNWRLRCANHVFGRGDKIDDGIVEFRSSPSVGWLVGLLVPVEELRDVVGQGAHAALPPVAAFDKGHVRVDVGSAAAAASNHAI
jgi:hypothetical protein